MKNIQKNNLDELDEELKREFEEKKKKKQMKVSGASVRNIQRIQEKRVDDE